MKKKLLTVLLAVVMVFGVFGLTSCGGSNPDEDYNYYGIKYELEDVRIQAATFQGVYKMFTTPGSFLLYVDSEGTGAADRFAAINDLANEWDVTIYHFNPNLSGGYAASKGASANILTSDIKGSGIETVQATLEAISGKKVADLKDNALWGIKGADSTVSGSSVRYNGKLSAQVAYAADANYSDALACTEKFPSYGDKEDVNRYVLDVINTMNLFGDARLHMYNDDNGVDALTDAKEDVYVTVANYAMFEHLMLNNEGYFPVFFGGTWCPNTQAIAKETDKLAKDYGITKIYFFDPRLDDAVKETKTFSTDKYMEDMMDPDFDGEPGYTSTYAVVENSAYLASALNTRSADPSDSWKALKELGQAKAYLAAVTTDDGLGFADSVTRDYSDKAIQAYIDAALIAKAATITNFAELKAAYIKAEKAKVKADDWKEPSDLAVAKAVIAAFNEAQEDEDDEIDTDKVALDALNVVIAAETKINADLKAKVKASYDAKTDAAYNYNYLYATFLDTYLPTYASQWNIGVKLSISGKDYTKMCVPNIMMFNGEGEGKAELVALAEAEYTYANVNEEGNAQQIAWDKAVKAVFEANPYAKYAPIVAAPEAAPEASAPAAGGSSAPAADAGGC